MTDRQIDDMFCRRALAVRSSLAEQVEKTREAIERQSEIIRILIDVLQTHEPGTTSTLITDTARPIRGATAECNAISRETTASAKELQPAAQDLSRQINTDRRNYSHLA